METELSRLDLSALQEKARLLSEGGWRFFRKQCDRGIYYDGAAPFKRGKTRERIMSTPHPDERTALANALIHAIRITEPLA